MPNLERVNKFKNENVAVNCETEEEAKSFIEWCYANGFEWYHSKSDETYFDYYKNKTCYTFNFCDCEHLGYGPKHFHEEKGYEVIKYKDFMGVKKITNLEAVASTEEYNEYLELKEKATPKKVVKLKKSQYGYTHQCPFCERLVGTIVYNVNVRIISEIEHDNYCCSCGQALDWSDEE